MQYFQYIYIAVFSITLGIYLVYVREKLGRKKIAGLELICRKHKII